MDIKDRIVKIIASEGLSSSSFADTIGVQRSSISHILSGRNKPSLDFLQKILLTFPKYNGDWLITGKGEIYKQPKQASLFDDAEIGTTNSTIEPINTAENKKENKIVMEEEQQKEENIPGNIGGIIDKTEKKEDILQQATKEDSTSIERIVMFYSDGTFKDYKPGK